MDVLLRSIFALAFLLSVCVGCGGTEPLPKTPSDLSAQAEVPIIIAQRHKSDSYANNAEATLRSALASAGYQVTNEPVAYGVKTRLNIDVKVSRPLFVVKINGKQSPPNRNVRVTLQVMNDGRAIEQFTASYSTNGPSATENDVRDIVDGFRRSPNIRRLLIALADHKKELEAHEQQKKADEEQRQEQAKAEADRRAKAEDDRAWISASPEKCEAPTEESDCDGVKKYALEHPMGGNFSEATDMLERATPKLATIREQNKLRAEQEEQRKIEEEARQREEEEAKKGRQQCVARCNAECSTSPDKSTCMSVCKKMKGCQ